MPNNLLGIELQLEAGAPDHTLVIGLMFAFESMGIP